METTVLTFRARPQEKEAITKIMNAMKANRRDDPRPVTQTDAIRLALHNLAMAFTRQAEAREEQTP